jgi:hypothetical protein
MENVAKNLPQSTSKSWKTNKTSRSQNDYEIKRRADNLNAALEATYSYLWLKSRDSIGGWKATKEILKIIVSNYSDDEIAFALAMCKTLKTHDGNYRLPSLLEIEDFAKQRRKAKLEQAALAKRNNIIKLAKPKDNPRYSELIFYFTRKYIKTKRTQKLMNFYKFISENSKERVIEVLSAIQAKENQELENAA